MNYDTAQKIKQIGRETFESFGRTAEEICTGDCTTFAIKMADKLALENIPFEIMVTDKFSLMDELKGYEVQESDYGSRLSHCYIRVDGFGYDAFNPEGVEEREMDFQTRIVREY